MGLALTERITIKDGEVQQSNFYDYTVMRMSDMPDILVKIISTDKRRPDRVDRNTQHDIEKEDASMSTLAESRLDGNIAAKIGGVLYVIWGAQHLVAAWGIHVLAASLPKGMAYGRMEQAAWNLALFALLAVALGISLNWRNDRLGYWINLIMVAAVDVGFIILIVAPGYVPASVASLAGPIVYVAAAIFSTAGRMSSRH